SPVAPPSSPPSTASNAPKGETGNKQGSLKSDPEKKQQRKDIVVLTPRAGARLREIMKPMKESQFLRVSVVDGAFKLDLDPETNPEKDYLGESQGVKVVVDRETALSVP